MRGRSFNKKQKKEVENQGEEVVAIFATTNDAESLFDPPKNDIKTLFIMIGWLILPPHPTLPTSATHLLHMNH